jgi:hypothetical protein
MLFKPDIVKLACASELATLLQEVGMEAPESPELVLQRCQMIRPMTVTQIIAKPTAIFASVPNARPRNAALPI